MRLADAAASRAAVKPAAGPEMLLAIHHTIGTTMRLSRAISPTTHVGSPPPSHAAGSSRS